MERMLNWKYLIPACALAAALPYVVPGNVFGIVLLLNTAVVAAGAYYPIFRRPMRTRVPMTLAATAGTAMIGMNVDWILKGGATGPVGSIFASVSSCLFLAAGAGLLAARRPRHYREGLLDGSAALAGLGALRWQLSGGEDLSDLAGVALTVLPISVGILFAGLLATIWRLLYDKQQNQMVIRCVIAATFGEGISAVASSSWSDPQAPMWSYSIALVIGWLLVGAYLHPDLPRIFDPEPNYERRLDLMRWLGPASALTVSPAITVLLVVRHEAPSIPVAIASVLLTCVVIVRIGRLLREREAGRRELALREQRFRSLVEHSSDVIAVTDRNGIVTYLNGGVEELMGIGPEKLIGISVAEVLAEEHRAGVARVLSQADTDTMPRRDLRLKRPDNQERWISVRITNHFETAGIGGWVLNIHDNTDRKIAEEALSRMALYDSLTGLPNRAQLRGTLEDLIARSPGTTALLFCDLDGFKPVNDVLGHDIGDEVLRQVAGRWSALLRAEDVLGRWGGDEFLVVCPAIPSMRAATDIAERLLSGLDEPVELSGGSVQLGCSIGLAIHTAGTSVDDLISLADTAMYDAKRARSGLKIA